PNRHFRQRVRAQVQVPEWMLMCAPFRRDYCIAVTGPRVSERLRAGLSALASDRRQQQHRQLADPTADLAAGKAVDALVHAAEDPESQVRHRSPVANREQKLMPVL